MKPSYPYNGNSHTGHMAYLYWINTLSCTFHCIFFMKMLFILIMNIHLIFVTYNSYLSQWPIGLAINMLALDAGMYDFN